MTRGLHDTRLDLFRAAIDKWLPKADIGVPPKALLQFDGILTWKTAQGPRRYLVEQKRHFRHQDVGVIVEQLNRRKADVPRAHAGDKVLLLAPHIRPQQAAALERAAIDYLDLAGNAHLQAPGLFVHVEGRQPTKEPATAPGRPHKGWIKAVMALLVRPELTNATYRTLAEAADVALGTVAGCMTDLIARGLVLDGKTGRRIANRQGLVALWVQAYVDVLRPKLRTRRFQVRVEGKPELHERLQTILGTRHHAWALTGADAAQLRTNFFRAEETEIYAPIEAFENRDIQKALVAQPAARVGNLLVIEPPGPLAIPDPTLRVPLAPCLLTYAELRYRGSGQALEAAELLLPDVLDDGTH